MVWWLALVRRQLSGDLFVGAETQHFDGSCEKAVNGYPARVRMEWEKVATCTHEEDEACIQRKSSRISGNRSMYHVLRCASISSNRMTAVFVRLKCSCTHHTRTRQNVCIQDDARASVRHRTYTHEVPVRGRDSR